MNTEFKAMLWKQFGAAIDMLETAIGACPDHLWSDGSSLNEFWYISFHTLFWLDLHISDTIDGFAPPEPFGSSELEQDARPERVYSKSEVKMYLEHCREKCRARIDTLTDEIASQLFRADAWGWTDRTILEQLIYNMRHVQHHVGQLMLMLRQYVPDFDADWVSRTKRPLHLT